MEYRYFYEREYYFCSNFSAFQVPWRGKLWMTAEHAYQASKFTDKRIISEIRKAPSPYDAKLIAKKYPEDVIANWGDIKLGIMEEIIRAKINKHSFIRRMIINSKSYILVEDSPIDFFWGSGFNGKGLNHLGKIWMKIRSELCSNPT